MRVERGVVDSLYICKCSTEKKITKVMCVVNILK